MLRSLAKIALATVALTAAPSAVSAQSNATITYGYRTYSQIVDAMLTLETKYPQYVEVFTAQERYGLPLRNELTCTRNGASEPCKHYVIKITDEATLPDAQRPEVFFSGALHGDERVGPQSAIALAEFLVDNAGRADGNPWIKRLVKTRTIVIMPTTNAYGYDKNTRQEGAVDPNRDFPYSKTGANCFRSMVARAVNEVWRAHVFQLAITWHGGTRAVSYEWGSYNHALNSNGQGSQKSPDDRAQFYVGKGLSRYAGKFQEDNTYYPDGTMNDVVYAVDGGMEDWGYAASWENAFTTPKPIGVCNPTTLGGYSTSKSTYDPATHRAFNILVETSTSKQPTAASLGTSALLSAANLADYLPSSTTVGHVPRNVRLALFYIDLVQPYLQWKTNPVSATAGAATSFSWEVAGSISVDATQLKYSKNLDLSGATTTTSQTGVTRWYHPDMGTGATNNKGIFAQSITFPSAGVYYVQASATVDQNWAVQPTTPVPNVKPQTHVVNARTNANWSYSANGKTVQGKLIWTSPIVQVTVL